MRFRHIFMGIGSVLVLLVLLLSDPDSGLIKNMSFGAGTLTLIITLTISVLYIGTLHLGRKGLIDYIDLEQYFKKAILSPEGAGLAIIGVGLIMISIALVILAATK